MKKIIKLKAGETIPEGAIYLKDALEQDTENGHWSEWYPHPNDGLLTRMLLMGREQKRWISPEVRFFYYEVEA